MSRTTTNPRIIEDINLTDVRGLIDPATGKIDTTIVPAVLSSATPAPLGVAAVGVEALAAHGDHVHAMPSAADVGALTQSSADTRYARIATPTVVSSSPYTIAAGIKPMFAGTIEWDLPAASTAQRYFFHVDSGTLTMDLDGTDTFEGETTNPVFYPGEGGEISTSGNGNWRFD
jgi:hypothetical protein